jgi:serine phosphatase RsbU (regulator of sigma subunit)
MGEYDDALTYFEESYIISNSQQNGYFNATILNNIGIIYLDKGYLDSALVKFDKSYLLREELGDKIGMASSLINISKVYNLMGKISKAKEFAESAIAISLEIGSANETKNASNQLYVISKKSGEYKKALEMYELYISTLDSIKSEENQKEILRQQFKSDYDRKAVADSIAFIKEREVEDIKFQKQESELQSKRRQQIILSVGIILLVAFSLLIFNRYRVTQRQRDLIEDQRLTVVKQNEITELQRSELAHRNKEITDSITYAKRIQSAILPSSKTINSHLTKSFILYKPKDIVAGDFYWMEPIVGKVLFAAADCTGHGVPGAMVSVVCNGALNRAVREFGLSEPGKILDRAREIVISEFEKSDEEVKDGMDISICALSFEHKKLEWSGANNALWIIRNGANEVAEFKPDKQPIGKYSDPKPFKTHFIQLNQGDSIYIFTDGFQDQFGGEKGKKFKAANLKTLLLSIQDESMEKQKQIIDEAFEDWRGSLEQVDDVCVIGVRI